MPFLADPFRCADPLQVRNLFGLSGRTLGLSDGTFRTAILVGGLGFMRRGMRVFHLVERWVMGYPTIRLPPGHHEISSGRFYYGRDAIPIPMADDSYIYLHGPI